MIAIFMWLLPSEVAVHCESRTTAGPCEHHKTSTLGQQGQHSFKRVRDARLLQWKAVVDRVGMLCADNASRMFLLFCAIFIVAVKSTPVFFSSVLTNAANQPTEAELDAKISEMAEICGRLVPHVLHRDAQSDLLVRLCKQLF
uniref:ABC transmembrane type-1 domain-containing protein n=1 Tax=Ascaris lumbricoides TaxID=6252 RepID=A0A0M3HTF3_ASCLU